MEDKTATVYGTAQKVQTAITSKVQLVWDQVISSKIQRYANLSKVVKPNAAKQKKKKKNTAKLEASVTHGAPGSTHDAHASNDAHASETISEESNWL